MRLNQGHRWGKLGTVGNDKGNLMKLVISLILGNWWEQQREPDEACYLIDPWELVGTTKGT
jgi:hypothetical protein